MADNKRPSVEEILAQCRQLDGDGAAAPSESPAPATAEPVAEEPVAAETPAEEPAAPAPKAKPGERPNVADILAMARANKAGGAAEKASPKPAAKAQPAAKTAAAGKASPKAPQPAKATTKNARLDTASILAAARGDAKKPGPITKAELAKQESGKKAPAKPKKPAPPMPKKPDYARPRVPSAKEDGSTRRLFIIGALFGTMMATGFTALAATAGIWTLAFARFMFPNVLREPPSRFKVGFPDGFPPGVVETKFKAQFGVWVVNYEYQGEMQIYALSTVCTHLGCTPNWLDAEQKFKCPCHGSGFYKDGVNFEGPAPRPLERYAIKIGDDGQLEVDKSKKFQEEMGQWADPASYVSV